MSVEKAGLSFTISKDPYETSESYNRRKWFIANLKPTSEELFKEYETYSRVFNNMLFLNCRYDPSLEKKVKELADHIKSGGGVLPKKNKKMKIIRKKRSKRNFVKV